MMDKTELKIHRMNTDAFIQERMTRVVLTPQNRERTAAGGYRNTDEAPRKPQEFRIIELGSSSSAPILRESEGSQRELVYWLLGSHDAIMEKDDYWKTEDGRDWIIVDVIRDNGYEVRGLVAERGR